MKKPNIETYKQTYKQKQNKTNAKQNKSKTKQNKSKT
jgi:hypothetical protein